MIHDDIRHLLEAPSSGANAPTLDDIEHTLTTGYASALALEAQRRRLERQLAQLVDRLAKDVTDEDASALAQLGQQISTADVDLNRLRALLLALRTRADEVRAAA